jgi:hypothetical protein
MYYNGQVVQQPPGFVDPNQQIMLTPEQQDQMRIKCTPSTYVINNPRVQLQEPSRTFKREFSGENP